MVSIKSTLALVFAAATAVSAGNVVTMVSKDGLSRTVKFTAAANTGSRDMSPVTVAAGASVDVNFDDGWEGNWIPFNAAEDVVLPGRADARPVHFLMYPQVETAAGLLDCYDPTRIRYTITARETSI